MPENERVEIIDVDKYDATNVEQEYPTDDNPGDNPSQNQDGIYNKIDVISVKDA